MLESRDRDAVGISTNIHENNCASETDAQIMAMSFLHRKTNPR